jgi:hypothetical protein
MRYIQSIKEGKDDWQVFQTMLYARLPQFVPVALCHRVKASLTPLAMFPGVLLYHAVSKHGYEIELDSNSYVIAVVDAVNVAISRAVQWAETWFPCPVWPVVHEDARMYPEQVVPLLWILLQSMGFWVVYFYHMRSERVLRERFLVSRGLPLNAPAAEPWDQIRNLAVCHMVFVYFYCQDFRIY